MAKRVQITWGDRLRQEGVEQGLQQEIVSSKKEDLLLIVRSRFHNVPEELAHQIEATQDARTLDGMLHRALTVTRPDDIAESFTELTGISTPTRSASGTRGRQRPGEHK